MGSVVKRFSGLLFLFLVLPFLAKAQTATLTGTASDATGASAAGVTVTAKNTQTNATRTATTTDTGLFRIPSLAPAVYEVVFEKNGFQTIRYTNVVLTVDQVLTLDAKLQVSAVAQTVEVNGQSVAPIELDNASISNVVDSKRINDLPLILRDPYQLILLSPGVVQSNTALGGFSVNGQRERNNNFLLDGLDNNDTEVPGIAGGITAINPDSTEEFRVITNNFLPEYGRNTGAIIDVRTKGGTNELHGDAYWFGRYDALGARDFFNHAPDTAKAPYVRNDFGASIGGPIVKDKTFFFANYEGQRFVTTTTNTSQVPTATFKTGIFDFTDANGKTTAINLNPGSAQNNTAKFFGTQLGADATTQKLLNLFPTGSSPFDSLRDNLNFGSSSRTVNDNFTVKVDHNLSKNEILSARYVFNRSTDPNPFHSDFLPGLDAVSTYQRTQNLSLNLTSTFSPTLVNELRGGGNRTHLSFACAGTNVFDALNGTDTFGRGADFGLPGLGGPSGTFGCGTLGDSNGQARFTGTYSVSDNLTSIHGKHTFKGGAEFRDVYSNSFNDFSSRLLNTLNYFSSTGNPVVNIDPANPCNPNDAVNFVARCGSTELQDLAGLYYGLVGTQNQGEFFNNSGVRTADDLRGFRQRELRLFIQDTWKVSSHFTLTGGLAWDYYGVPFEVHNNLSTLLTDPSGPAPFTFSIVGPGAQGQLYRDSLRNFEPRVGFAWDPFGKGTTSIRAGYGIFHDRTFGNLFGNVRGNPPFTQTFSNINADQLVNLPKTAPTLTPSLTVPDGSFISPILLAQDFRSPLSQTWNFGIEHQLPGHVTVEVEYVGSHSTRLFRQVDGNPPQPELVADALAAGVPAAALQRTNLYLLTFNDPRTGNPNQTVVNNTAFFHTFTEESTASALYHALQLNVTKQLSHGFQIQGAYTYAHAIDDASDPLAPGGNVNAAFPRNSFNLLAERGNSDFDVRHRAVLNYLYEIPLGAGKAHLSEGFVGKLFEGFQIAGITTFSSGLPYDIFGSTDNQHTGFNDRPDLIGSPAIPAGSDRTQTGPLATSFANAAFGSRGNLGRNVFTAPGVNNTDIVLTKNTKIFERFTLQFRSEFYNVFNRAQLGVPDNHTVDGAAFGTSTTQVGRADGTSGARQIQFSLKLLF